MNKTLLLFIWGMAALFPPLSLSAKFRVTVPYCKENGKIMVAAEVNGCKGRFLIDTGAPCSLTRSFAKRTGIVPFDSTEVQDSNGNLLMTHVAELGTLKVGDITFKGMQAVCLEENNIVERFGIDGIIGYNLMRMGIVKFDDKNRIFTLTDSEEGLGLDSLAGIPLIEDFSLARIPVRLGESGTDTVMFDSGASCFYSISTAAYHRMDKEHPETFALLGKGTGILSLGAAGIEKASDKYRLEIQKLMIGDCAFANVTAITTDAADSRIGTELLEHGNVIIDYLKNLFYYSPSVPGLIPDMYKKEWNAVITVIDGYLTVGMVWDAGQSSLKGGERIVEIEGRKYGKVDLFQSVVAGGVLLPDRQARIKYIDRETGEIKETVIKRE